MDRKLQLIFFVLGCFWLIAFFILIVLSVNYPWEAFMIFTVLVSVFAMVVLPIVYIVMAYALLKIAKSVEEISSQKNISQRTHTVTKYRH